MEQIIYDLLISGTPVWFPDLGTLRVIKIPARFSNAGVVPPKKELRFDRDVYEGRSAVEIAAQFHGVLSSEVQELYSGWVAYNSTDEAFTIAGIGTFGTSENGATFVPDPVIAALFKPFGEEPTPFSAEVPAETPKGAGAGKIVLIIVGAIVGIAALGAAYLYFVENQDPVAWFLGGLQ